MPWHRHDLQSPLRFNWRYRWSSLRHDKAREPCHHGNNNGIRHKIGSYCKCGLIIGCWQRSLDMIKSNVHNERVGDCDQHRQHHREWDKPRAYFAITVDSTDMPIRRIWFSSVPSSKTSFTGIQVTFFVILDAFSSKIFVLQCYRVCLWKCLTIYSILNEYIAALSCQ